MATSRDIVDKLGGYREVAKALGIGDPRIVHKWTRPGREIPGKFRLTLGRIAEAGNVEGVTLGVLEQLEPNAAEAAAA